MRIILLLLVAVAGYCAELGTEPFPVTSAAPSGAAGGDLSGTYPNPTVAAARFATPGAIGSGTPSTGAFTTVSATGVITSTLATGTAPFTVASTTQVTNLNSSQLVGATWAAPAAIGSGTPAAGTFTTVIANTVTDATSGSTGGISTLGGGGFTKAIWVGTNITWANGLADGTITDSATNSNTNVLTLRHHTSGTPAAGYGTGILFIGHSDNNTARQMCGIQAQWAVASDATRTSVLKFYTINSAAALAQAFAISGASANFSSGFPLTVADTTNTTTAATGGFIASGGGGFAKNVIAGFGVHAGVASIVTAAGTTVLAATSVQTQVFTGSTTQSVTMPAANLFGAGISVHFTIVNRSTGTVTLNRAGSDTFNAAATSFACVTVTVTEVWSDGVSAWYTK